MPAFSLVSFKPTLHLPDPINPKNAKFISEDKLDFENFKYINKPSPEVHLKNIALLTQEKDICRPVPCYIKPADATPSLNKAPNILK